MTLDRRGFNAKKLSQRIQAAGIAAAHDAMEARARGAASSIIDPATGVYADVFVDRLPDNKIALRTTGSPAFARILQERLGVGIGEVRTVDANIIRLDPKVYLAHASEDKAIVRPIAEHLMANGIEVWFDEWEIEPGDSLRRKMEDGLGAMTHFVVVLTPISITKPWVAQEIDAAMVRHVGGESRMVPLVVGLEPKELSPFVQAMLFMNIDPTNLADLRNLVDRLHGVSQKPALGPAPSYVKSVPEGLAGWSSAAVTVGRLLVETSVDAMPHDPIMTIDEIAAATGMGLDDTRLAVLDLKEAGYLWEGSLQGHVAAECALYADFDAYFMPFSPAEDAKQIANQLVNSTRAVENTAELAQSLQWPPRRMNSAICYMIRAGVIETRHALSSAPWRAVHLIKTDRTLRFARNNANA